MLCGRDWIEDHLNYERRHHITDKEVDSAAEFTRHRTYKTSTKTKNSLDLRSHMAPKAAVDVYKVKTFNIIKTYL